MLLEYVKDNYYVSFHYLSMSGREIFIFDGRTDGQIDIEALGATGLGANSVQVLSTICLA